MSYLRKGDEGPDVERLQTLLIRVGYDPVRIDGVFGLRTLAAVRRFQLDHHLDVDGEVGPATWGALDALTNAAGSIPLAPPAAKAWRTDPGRVCRDVDELRPDFRAKLAALLDVLDADEDLATLGLSPFVLETYRTPERQAALFAQGRTTPGRIVTNATHSRHTDRTAADVGLVDATGGVMWSAPSSAWGRIGAAAASVGLTWGGNWPALRDTPHVQLD